MVSNSIWKQGQILLICMCLSHPSLWLYLNYWLCCYYFKVQSENPLLLPKGISIVRKLGFPDVIMPGWCSWSLAFTIKSAWGFYLKQLDNCQKSRVDVRFCFNWIEVRKQFLFMSSYRNADVWKDKNLCGNKCYTV